MKPLIGITCAMGMQITSVNMRHMPPRMHQLNDAYMKAVALAGGIPVLIPVYEDVELVKDVIDRLDGVLLTGGEDPDPAHYGQRATGRLGTISPRRDAFDFAVVRYVLQETEKPVLAICRGTQVMNVAMGGSLHIDLEAAGKLAHMLAMYPLHMESHEAEVAKDTRLAEILGEGLCGINSIHHQAIKDVAEGFTPAAVSVPDGVVESIELPGERFVLGVQWHPEEMTHLEKQLGLFRALVRAASGQ